MNENPLENITAEQIDAYGLGEQPTPSSAVTALDRLVGEWTVSGSAEGVIRYEWMAGRFFLLQHVELEQFGQAITGIEVIGQLRPFGEPAGTDVVSRFYDSMGNTLDYVYELEGRQARHLGGSARKPGLLHRHLQRWRSSARWCLGIPR